MFQSRAHIMKRSTSGATERRRWYERASVIREWRNTRKAL
jgi:hypothetical protein